MIRQKESISPNRLKANRDNAKHSTGPKTAEGKTKSSRNSTQHGLLSAAISPIAELGETGDQLIQLATAITETFAPQNAIEEILTEQLVSITWRLRRAQYLENLTFENHCQANSVLTPIDESQLTLIIRYQSTLNRQFHQTLNQLRRMKSESQQQELKNSLLEKRQSENYIRDFIFSDIPTLNRPPRVPELGELQTTPEAKSTFTAPSACPTAIKNTKLRNEPITANDSRNQLQPKHLTRAATHCQRPASSQPRTIARKTITAVKETTRQPASLIAFSTISAIKGGPQPQTQPQKLTSSNTISIALSGNRHLLSINASTLKSPATPKGNRTGLSKPNQPPQFDCH